MGYVLDSNVAVKWILEEDLSDKARRIRGELAQGIHELLAHRRLLDGSRPRPDEGPAPGQNQANGGGSVHGAPGPIEDIR